ncbi:MAG TPA: UbiA-like polyprenyltransferase [Gemmataceae bacterium]|nr:UbiA-like polyprenyltransferase [Gemmataceae bacterium]
MFHRVRLLLELIRFSHTVFALPFALTSAVLAWKDRWHGQAVAWPALGLDLLGILLCMVFARSAAMAFNRLADQPFDSANPRTAGRHLPTGRLTRSAVWLFTAVCAAAFIAATLIFVASSGNWWPFYLAVPALLVIGSYSYTKRFTSLSHFWLGASLFLAPVGAWVAIRGMEALAAPVVLGLAVLFWVAGFDILYACQDVDFDRQARLKSVPARLGVRAGLRVAMLCHAVMVGLLFALYWAAAPHLGVIYLVGVAAVTGLLVYEHWLVRPDDLSRVNQAFFQVNAVVSIGLFAVVLLQLVVGV